MTDRKEVARRALVEAVILKHLKVAHERTRAELGAMFTEPGEREVGTLQDHRLGTVELRAGIATMRVVDDAAFTEWALQHFPQEVLEVRYCEVRSSFRDLVLKQCLLHGGLLNKETGEIEEVPGIDVRTGAPSLVERPDKHASFVVAHWLGDAAEQIGIEAK